MATPPASSSISSRSLRRHHATLLRHHASLAAEQQLLARLWYKSRAQFRNAKWMGPCDVVRRRMGVMAKIIEEALRSSAALFDALTVSDKTEGGSTSTSTALQTLPKRSPAHTVSPPLKLVARHLISLLTVLCALDELSQRTRTAFNLLESHLRTPPAPTFAALVTTMLGLCAGVHARCSEGMQSTAEAYGEVAATSDMAKGRPIRVESSQATQALQEGRSKLQRKKRGADEEEVAREVIAALPASIQAATPAAKGTRNKTRLPPAPVAGSRRSLVDELLETTKLTR